MPRDKKLKNVVVPALNCVKPGLVFFFGAYSVSAYAQAISPASQFSLGAYTSIQVNVDERGQNIAGDAGNETTIAVNPNDSNNIVIGWRQFNAEPNAYVQGGWTFATDGGLAWNLPGVLPALPGQRRTDPVLDVDSQGNFYYQSLAHTVNGGTELLKSLDGGRTWQEPVYMFTGDKNWLAIDRNQGEYDGQVYSVWRDTRDPKHFVRSVDRGASFQQPDEGLPVDIGFGQIAVDARGDVLITGRNEIPQEIVGGNSFEPIYFLQSADAKDATVSPAFIAQELNMGGTPVSYFGINTPNPSGGLGDILVATDHSSSELRGNIYVLAPLDPPGVDKMDIQFVSSSDGGKTWSDPVRVNDDPASKNSWQWFAMMSVAPNSRIDAVWYDTRDSGTHEVSQLYYAYSWDGGSTWSRNQPVSPPFNTHLPKRTLSDGSQQPIAKMGDYTHMVSDANGGHVAYAATYNGEHDVYYLNVFPDCDGNKLSDVEDNKVHRYGDTNSNHIPDSCEDILVLGDVDGDRDVDRADMNLLLAAKNQPASGPGDPRDLDQNGTIDLLDVRKQILLCTRPRCTAL